MTKQVTLKAHSRSQKHRRNLGHERGAVLVEFSFVAVFLVLLVMGLVEFGSAWKDHQVVTSSSRSGARVVSQLGTAGVADQEALKAVSANYGNRDLKLSRVVVYEADQSGEMPVACRTAAPGYSGGAPCNVYGPDQLEALDSPGLWGSDNACGSADTNWCPALARNDTQNLATFVGVLVEAERNWITGLLGGGVHTLSEQTVMRIEPAR